MESLIERLRKRAEIRRNIPTRKSVQNKEPDRIADLLDEAATELGLWIGLCKNNCGATTPHGMDEQFKLRDRETVKCVEGNPGCKQCSKDPKMKDVIDTLEFYGAGIPFAEKLYKRITGNDLCES